MVTAGLLGGLGVGILFTPVYSIIGALDGLFDMGRTAVNVSGGLQATTIVSKVTKQLENDEILSTKRKKSCNRQHIDMIENNDQNEEKNET